MLCGDSEDSYFLCWGQSSLCSSDWCEVSFPAEPLWAAWVHDAFYFLVLAAVHAPCVSVSPGETLEAAPRLLIPDISPDNSVFGFAAPLCWRSTQKAGWKLSSCGSLTLGNRKNESKTA